MDDLPLPSHTADLQSVMELIDSDADIRLVTMIGFGYLENYLGELLRAHLRELPEDAKDFLFNRSLKHLSQRIDFGLALGSVTPEVAKTLRIFAEIRNRFAHRVEAKDCTDPKIADLVGRITIVNSALEELGQADLDADSRLRLLIAATVDKLHHLIDHPFKS